MNLQNIYPSHPKDRGQWAELLFMATAARLDLKVARPYGDNARFDVIVEADGQLHRVQIKCTKFMRNGFHHCTCCWSRSTSTAYRPRLRYTRRHVDFIAAYVIADDSWFIIPVGRIRSTDIGLPRLNAGSRSKWEQFREAWHLLGVRPGGGLNAREPALSAVEGAPA